MSLLNDIKSRGISDVISGGFRKAVSFSGSATSETTVETVGENQRMEISSFLVSSDSATDFTLKLGSDTVCELDLSANSPVPVLYAWHNAPVGAKDANLTVTSTAGLLKFSCTIIKHSVAPLSSI